MTTPTPEAIEAAAQAIADADLDDEPSLWQRELATAALTAAAPFIAAQALRDAADEIRRNPYDDLDPFYADYLVSRAYRIEGKDS